MPPNPAQDDSTVLLERLPLRVRLGFWPSRKQVARNLLLTGASMLWHVALAVLIVLLDLNTNIAVEISWSDEALHGIGSHFQSATAPPPLDEPELEPSPDSDVSPPPKAIDDTPHWPKKPTTQVLAQSTPPSPKPSEKPKPKTPAQHISIQGSAPPMMVERVEAQAPDTELALVAEEPEPAELPEPSEAVETPSEAVDPPLAPATAERLGSVLLSAARLGQPSDAAIAVEGHVGEALPGLDDYGPGNARLIVVIRNDRVRGSIYEEHVRSLLKAFPDYQIALSKSGIDPLESLDAFVIATANPALYTETFLAVRHQLDEKVLRLALKHSFMKSLQWDEYHGRPIARPTPPDDPLEASRGIYARSVLFAEPGLTLFLPNTLLPAVFEPLPPRDGEQGHDLGGAAPRTLLDTLHAFENLDGAEDTSAAVFVLLKGITSMRFGSLPELPTPIALSASLTPAENPRIILRLEFADPSGAESFVDAWPGFVKAAGSMGIPGLTGLLRAIDWERHEAQVYGDGELNGLLVGLILSFATSSIPQING